MTWFDAFGVVSFVVLGVVTVMSLHTVSRMFRAHARERDLLVNQILHLSGHTWTPPPADTYQPPDDDEPADERFSMTPGQLPDLWGEHE